MSLSKACYPGVQWRAFRTTKSLLDLTRSTKVSMKKKKKANKQRREEEAHLSRPESDAKPGARSSPEIT